MDLSFIMFSASVLYRPTGIMYTTVATTCQILFIEQIKKYSPQSAYCTAAAIIANPHSQRVAWTISTVIMATWWSAQTWSRRGNFWEENMGYEKYGVGVGNKKKEY